MEDKHFLIFTWPNPLSSSFLIILPLDWMQTLYLRGPTEVSLGNIFLSNVGSSQVLSNFVHLNENNLATLKKKVAENN